MFGLGLPEIVIILIVVAIFFVDGDKLAEISRGLGRFTGEFKKGKEGFEGEVNKGDKLSELSRGLGRFTGEFKRGKAEIESGIENVKEELKSVKMKITDKM